ncbi:MAG: hypothetical protein AUK48_12795 [Oscillatoriales cyanobacterium CG2_30_44_21]|nr:MAG: hypothetical protein AUK48_12795 [Oscillatoriales cyanobacterium CG2_30_44_21]
MDSNLFYDDGAVRVTRSLFEAGGTQFPIRNIAAVKTLTESPDRKGPIICIVLGVLLLGAYGLGLIGIGLGVFWWISQKELYYIVVVSGGADQKAYVSPDVTTIRKIQSAINSALELH